MLTGREYARVALRRHNGADTLFVEDRDGVPYLGWMLIGQVESFALILDARLDWDDVQALSDDPQMDPRDVLAGHAGEGATLYLMTPDGGGSMTGPLPECVDARWALDVLDHVTNAKPAVWAGDIESLPAHEVRELEELALAV